MNWFSSFLIGGGIGVVLRDAASGFISEWIKDFWSEVKRKRKLRYNQGRAILNLITSNLGNIQNDPKTEEIIKLKQHIYGLNKRLAGMLEIYARVRKMLFDETARLNKKGALYSAEDLKMFGRFGEEISIMHEGLTIEAHHLMGNGLTSYYLNRIKFLFFGRLILNRLEKIPVGKTLGDLIRESKEK